MAKSLEVFENRLAECERDPVVFFGDNPDSKLREIQLATHPDLFVYDSVLMKRATEIFQRFSSLRDSINDVEYIGDYRIIKKIALGDLCHVYNATKNGELFVVKKPRVKAKALIKKEFETCQKLSSGSSIHSMMVPNAVELLDGQMPVYEWRDDLISGSEVIAKFGDNLDSRHIIWMFKRTLMILGFAHNEGIIHGAVTPDHLLFSKPDHGLIICGWVHSGEFGGSIKVVPAKWKHYYPDEALKDKKLSTSLDIFMAAKSMLDIGGANIHPRVKRFLESCLLPVRMRPDNAWALHDEVKEMARDVFGNAKFLALN